MKVRFDELGEGVGFCGFVEFLYINLVYLRFERKDRIGSRVWN